LISENSSIRGYKNRNEDFVSTLSESTSAGSSVIPMSTTDSSLRCESMLHQINPTVPFNPTAAYQMPQRYMQSVASQFHQANVAHSPMGIPVGYPQVQGHPKLSNIQHSQPLQLVYPMKQCQARTQDWARMPTSTTAVPYMMHPISYPTQNLPEPHQVSSVAPSAMSPVYSFSSPGYVNTYGYISTPVLSSGPCTPVAYQTAYAEVLPTLNLHKTNMEGSNIPQGMSCNINMGPVSGGCRSAPEKPAAVWVNSNNLPLKQLENLKMGTATGSVGEGAPEQEEEDEEEEDLWLGKVNYAEYRQNGSSNLFVTWSGTKAELVEKMQSYHLQVRDILTTVDDNMYNLIFVSQPIARKAFTMQQQIGLRIVPPRNSHRNWLRNPSPKFMVKFETKCRLVVRKGRAKCHDIVGELLKGCLICADQLKGHRIRVVCCEGSFKFPGGKIVQMKGLPNNSDEKTALGWISYRCKYTKESLVIRKSWNKLRDYVFKVK